MKRRTEVSETYDTDRPGTEENESEQRGTAAQPSGRHGEPGREAEEREREERETYGGIRVDRLDGGLPRDGDESDREAGMDDESDDQGTQSGSGGGEADRQGGMVDSGRQND
jgi:hypothetical protein